MMKRMAMRENVVGAAEHIHHKQALVGQLLLRQLLAGIPSL